MTKSDDLLKLKSVDFSKAERQERSITVRVEASVFLKLKRISDSTNTTTGNVIRSLLKYSLARVDMFGKPIKKVPKI